jgi:hypothetical protein
VLNVTFTLTHTMLQVNWNGARVQGIGFHVPHTAIAFTAPAGPGGPVALEVVVGGQASTPTALASSLAYQGPSLTDLSLAGDASPFDCGSQGSGALVGQTTTLRLAGGNFGTGEATIVTVGGVVASLLRTLSSHAVLFVNTTQCR